MRQDLDAVLRWLLATCSCAACERYRRAFAQRAGYYAAKIEEQLKRGHT